MWAVEVQNVKKTYDLDGISIEVLRGVSFCVSRGEILAITGESGSGKSTLLHILGALDAPSSGRVLIGGVCAEVQKDAAVSHFRNKKVGFVFQHNNLLPEFNALENVMMPALIAGKNERLSKKAALFLLERMDMTHRLAHMPSQLSGGEQQRIAIARALINSPELVLADEPSGNLDSRNAENVHQLFVEINRTLGTTILVVTHNLSFASSLPRGIELCDGLIAREWSN